MGKAGSLLILNFFVFSILISILTRAQEAKVYVKLSPAGSFVGTTKDVTGTVEKKGDEYFGKNIIVNLTELKTGIELRDHHTLKYLEVEKYPKAELISASGKNGIGKGKIKIRGIEKEIEGSFNIKGNMLSAKFPLQISDFKISGIKYMGVGVKDQIQIEVSVPIK